jgi:hypothetical protein
MKTDTLQPSFLQPTNRLDRSSFLEQGHSIDEVAMLLMQTKASLFAHSHVVRGMVMVVLLPMQVTFVLSTLITERVTLV